MFTIAILLGIYAQTLFFLGVLGLFYKSFIVVFTLAYAFISSFFYKRYTKDRLEIFFISKELLFKNKLIRIFFLLFMLQTIVNLIGTLGPELAFDALWYHLILPKLYLLNHSIFHIPGGLLYYSDMPKLGEMFYVGGLSFGNEIAAKLIHFVFGILTSIALYIFARKFFAPLLSIIAVVIFYSNLVVAWESTTAYVDLIRTFYEFMALWGFMLWYKSRELRWLILSALMLGFAITTKLLAFGSLFIFIILFIYIAYKNPKIRLSLLKDGLLFFLISIFIPLPWFIFSYINTGNPVYPFFSNLYMVIPEPFSIMNFISEVWKVFLNAPDPLSPVYIVFLPLVFILFNKFTKSMKLLTLYSLLAVIVWYFTPRTGGGRFILPYLPALSIICAAALSQTFNKVRWKKSYVGAFLMSLIIVVSVISIGYRSIANSKYLSVITGQQTKHNFLIENLNFSYGDFYDTDGYFKNRIESNERVLLYGFHNLYYVEFSFIDSSWVREGDKFHYIAVQNMNLPARYKDWQMIYSNDKTRVKLYKHRKLNEVTF